MKETIKEWLIIASDAKKALGLDTILLFVGLLMFLGVIESPLTTAHDDIRTLLRQNQVLVIGEYGYRHVECVNRADVDATSDQAKFLRLKDRCDQNFSDVQRQMRSLGIILTSTGDKPHG